jgi:hypothetical protein
MWLWKKEKKEPYPSYQPSYTILLYYWNNIPYTVQLQGGPGGLVTLTDNETERLFKEINSDVLYGFSSAELTADQVIDSEIVKEALSRPQPESSSKKDPARKSSKL